MQKIIESVQREYDFVDLLEARETGDPALINEMSLARVYQHVKDTEGEDSMAILTGWRAGRTRKQNDEANAKLMADIRSLGLGAFKLLGRWKECPEGQNDCEPDERVLVKEHSFGVIGMSHEDTKRLVKKYGQDAAVYLGPETEGKAVLVYPHRSDDKIGAFTPSKVADVYSQIRGSTFVFEGWEYPTQTPTEAQIERTRSRR